MVIHHKSINSTSPFFQKTSSFNSKRSFNNTATSKEQTMFKQLDILESLLTKTYEIRRLGLWIHGLSKPDFHVLLAAWKSL
jgi:hypothetical protein